MKKIVVINAYGDKNIGDAAILHVALKFINEALHKKCEIIVLCENTKAFSTFIGAPKNARAIQLPYGYAIRGKSRVTTSTKMKRFFDIYFKSLMYVSQDKLLGKKLPQDGFYSYIAHIKDADKVVGMGGGYYTTNHPLKDYFGLMLTLLPVYIAKAYRKDILSLPMSFGPFASNHHERLAYHALKDTTLMSRDDITLKQVESIDTKKRVKTFYAPDLALHLKSKTYDIQKKLKSDYIILTAREWFSSKAKQDFYEHSLVHLIDHAWKEHGLKTVFVPMARNDIEDDDNRVAKRLYSQIASKRHFDKFDPKSLTELQGMIGHARGSICTRMHSAILSATVHTPFIAIGYGHKTLGFVKSYNLEKWHIDIGDVTPQNIQEKLEELLTMNNYLEFSEIMTNREQRLIEYKNRILSVI